MRELEWQGVPYDPKFFKEMSQMLRSTGRQKEAKQYEKAGLEWNVAWFVAILCGWLLGKALPHDRVVVPHPGMNRRQRRAWEKNMRKVTRG